VPHRPVTVGPFEVTPLCDGWAPLPLAEEMPGGEVDWTVERERYPWAFAPNDEASWAWHVHAFVVRGPDAAIIVDCGIGTFGRPPFDVEGHLEEELRELDVSTEAVDHVVLTHLHADHSGGTCRPDGTPTFPRARHHVHPADWSFFEEHRAPGDFTARFAMSPIEQGGILELDPTDRAIVPGLEVVHAPGHTPGHRVVLIGTGDERLLLAGDLLHVPPQVRDTVRPSNHDEDPELGALERGRHLAAAREAGWIVGISHFGWPFGHVGPDGWSPT